MLSGLILQPNRNREPRPTRQPVCPLHRNPRSIALQRLPSRRPSPKAYVERAARDAARTRLDRAQRPDRLSAGAPSALAQKSVPGSGPRNRVHTETGKILRIFTNDLDAPADEVAELYKRRWQIELFFRWVKHTLKIRHFLGTSENAVRIQIAVALIAFLLLRAAHALQNSVQSLLAFARLVSQNLMHRRSINHLLEMPPPTTQECAS